MGAIQNSINYALGTAAIASGLTNKKTAEKAQDKLDDKTKELTNTEDQLVNTKEDLAKTTAEKNKIEQQVKDEQDEKNMQYGLNTFNVSNDLPTAKEVPNATNTTGDKSVDNNSINPSIASSMKDYLNANKKANPYEVEQIMGFHALKMLDSRIAAKRAVIERSNRAMMKIDPRTKRALEDKNGGNE